MSMLHDSIEGKAFVQLTLSTWMKVNNHITLKNKHIISVNSHIYLWEYPSDIYTTLEELTIWTVLWFTVNKYDDDF